MLVFEQNHAMIELTTKSVVSSPLGIFPRGFFVFSETLKSGVCL
ncbi:hypothetical protein [Bacillus altitudinis]|nr:hypothetical protein [Bacillus altitudinis]